MEWFHVSCLGIINTIEIIFCWNIEMEHGRYENINMVSRGKTECKKYISLSRYFD